MRLNAFVNKVVAVIISIGLVMPNPGYAAETLKTANSEAALNLLASALKGAPTNLGAGLMGVRGRSEMRADWTAVQGNIEKWLPEAQKLRLEDFNMDMFRDYDYRYVKRNIPLKPEIVFVLTLVWAKMALRKAAASGIKTRDVLIARDARKIEPEIVDAQIAALRYAGLNVVFVGDEPNCVTSYSWAVQSREWLMTLFNTASHVSHPADVIVRGFKGAQLTVPGGNLLSLTTKEIKQESLKYVKEMMADKEKMTAMKALEPGKLDRKSVEAASIRFNTAVGLVADKNESIYQLGRDIKLKESEVVVSSVVERLGQNKPLAGLRVAVEGFHAPSGLLAEGVFRNLGADVTALNTDIQEITGLHPADPSIDKNLEILKAKIIESRAGFGIAFDLDGDRGAIIIPEWNVDGAIKLDAKGKPVFHVLSPDNILGMLMPYFLRDWGYAGLGKNIGVIRDVVGTYGVNDSARKHGVTMFQTDAGYIYLKKLKEEMEAKGYVFPVYGERSGHTWLNVSGEIENPVAVAVLFSVIVAKNKAQEQPNGILKLYQDSTIPYTQSPRFQPFYHPGLLQWLSDHNSLGWNYVPGVNPPQAIVALGKDETVKRLRQEFQVGKKFGEYEISEFNTDQDPVDEGGLFRFADIMFQKNGVFVGRVVVRASSNDPTFVMSYESPIWDGQVATAVQNRIATAGLVMTFMANAQLGIFTEEQMRRLMPSLSDADRKVQFHKSNLGPVEADYRAFTRSESREAEKTDEKELAVVEAAPVDFARVIGNTPLIPANRSEIRGAFTSSFQEPVIFTPEFAFDREMAGLPMIPVLAGQNPSAVIVRNRSEARMLEDFNAQLPVGVARILVANSPEQAVSLLRQAMVERVRRGLAKAGAHIRAIATASSADIIALKNQIGDQGIFIATQGWLIKIADRAGLTAVIQQFSAALATAKSA